MLTKSFIKPHKSRLSAGLCALAMVAAIPAMAAPVTFAQYIQLNGAQQQWNVVTSANTTTVTASGAVLFSFSGVSGLPFAGPENAMFTLQATSTSAGNCGVNCGPGDSLVQAGYSGMFSFTDMGSAFGANLLSGTFTVTGTPSTTGAQFSSHMGSSGASFNASSTAGNLNQLILSSAYLNFNNQTQENSSWSISSFQPNFATGVVTNGTAFPAAGPFNGSGTGTFSSNPGPTATPEPATFALLGSAMIAIPWMVRRRRKSKIVDM